jgi:uncharacterized Zn-finger protein
MPPKSDASNEIETTTSNKNNKQDGENKIPWKDRIKTTSINLMHSARLFIYNKEHQTFFGNTPLLWVKISIYYIIFYICLGLFYSGMVAVFGAIISRQSPTYTYNNSRMNTGGPVAVGLF